MAKSLVSCFFDSRCRALQNDSLHNLDNKTANVNIKNCSLLNSVNSDGSNPAKIIKKVILLSITLTFSLIQTELQNALDNKFQQPY